MTHMSCSVIIFIMRQCEHTNSVFFFHHTEHAPGVANWYESVWMQCASISMSTAIIAPFIFIIFWIYRQATTCIIIATFYMIINIMIIKFNMVMYSLIIIVIIIIVIIISTWWRQSMHNKISCYLIRSLIQ